MLLAQLSQISIPKKMGGRLTTVRGRISKASRRGMRGSTINLLGMVDIEVVCNRTDLVQEEQTPCGRSLNTGTSVCWLARQSKRRDE